MKKLGLDPAKIKFAIVSHGHNNHSGGAKYLQDHFGTQVILSAADWEWLDRNNPADPKPKRDIVATDGQKLTLGDTTLTLHLTPGHTLGTISTLIPVKDGGRSHLAAQFGGMGFNWLEERNRARYITSERTDRFWFETYSTRPSVSARLWPRRARTSSLPITQPVMDRGRNCPRWRHASPAIREIPT